jgi:hypothetical protein
VVKPLAALVIMRLGERRPGRLQRFADEVQAGLEALLQLWGVEDDVADFPPQVRPVLAADDADRALELLAAQPQLAVQGTSGRPATNQSGAWKRLPRRDQSCLPSQ